jgi:hypothetical protein
VNWRTWLTACSFAATLGVAGGAVHASITPHDPGTPSPPASGAALPAPHQQAGTATARPARDDASAAGPQGSSPVVEQATGPGRPGSAPVKVHVPGQPKSKPAKEPKKPATAPSGHGPKKAHDK